MKNHRIALCVALQRYTNFPPVTEKQREMAVLLAKTHGLPVEVISVKAPVALAPSAETVEEKTEAFARSVEEAGVKVTWTVLEGRPSAELIEHLKRAPADWVICGSHSKRSFLDLDLGNTAKALMRGLDATVVLVKGSAADVEATEAMKIPHYPVVFPYG